MGVEALIRWHRPQSRPDAARALHTDRRRVGLDSPDRSLGARRTPAGRRALGRTSGLAPISVAINVSAVELRAKDFLGNVRQILEQIRLEPRFLEIELTETFMMQDWKSTAEILRALKGLGVQHRAR